ncbi:MAG: 2-C-methyl-D-erythritol 2,4-cyclodiphosphate synthase, partial [Tepidisphaeraceae bacterium]
MSEPPKRRRIFVAGLTPARKIGAAEDSVPSPATAPFLIGHGYDIHRLQTGGKLLLGGVVVSEEVSADAHSDGDVILHAVTDAILGAMALGDIGQHFPPADPKWKGVASRVFVEDAYQRARRAGYALVNLDITLMLERPKVAPYRDDILRSLRQMFAARGTINLKAGTNEGCDAV